MNRTLLGWAIILLVLAIAMMVSPIPLDGSEQLTPLVYIGIFLIPVVIVVAVAGGMAPDPERLTVSGALGNADENELLRARQARANAPAPRTFDAPRRSVNCRKCYTLIAWDVLYCPRCTTPRLCRSCAGALELEGSSIECTRCRHPEIYCNCPGVARAAPISEHTRRRAIR